jgi:hypothetical protein
MKVPQQPVQRRGLLAGAGAVGALATAAAVLPKAEVQAPVATAQAPADSQATSGYRLTEHVKAYYSSTRI